MAVYVSLLGNEPGPAYIGLKFVRSRAGSVEEAVFYAERPWPGYEKKWEALLRLLEEEGTPYRLLEAGALDGAGVEPGEGVWVNLTGGSKLLALRSLRRWQGTGARVFLLDAHRDLEAPRALFFLPEEGEEVRDGGAALTLADYLRLYLRPEGEEVEPVQPPRAFLQGAEAVRLHGRGGGLFVVYRGRPYWVRPHLGNPKGEMERNALAQHRQEAQRLGGYLCRPVVAFHAAHLQSLHAKQRGNVLARWRAWAQEQGVLLAHPEKPLAAHLAPQAQGKAPKKALPAPQGPSLLALLSEQSMPLYAAYLHAKPEEVYPLATGEMEGQLRSAQAFFREQGVRVHFSFLSSPWAWKEVVRLLGPVVEEASRRGLPVHANLNGGTTALAMGLFLALGKGVEASYLDRDRLLRLEGGELPVPWGEGDPEAYPLLRVYRLLGKVGRPYPDPELLALARRILEGWEEAERGWDTSPLVKGFLDRWRRFGREFSGKDRGSLKGLALEYLAFAELQAHLATRGGRAAMGGNLVPLGGREDLGGQNTEVDGVLLYRGALWFLECKPTARELRKRAPFMESLVQGVAGTQGKGLMLARDWGNAPPPERSPRLVYMALRVPEGVEGVHRFPEDLDKVLP
ncbi:MULTISPECIES: hypothetical protein [Thermus]|uniref:hypothetical protein n=1 Tax=Thermus TaxID=270 RepID=UPI001F1EE2E4|nr:MULTISPECIES: hypothetical protein [Thermus]